MTNKPIPNEITDHGLFCCWRYEERNGKQTKVPYNPRTGERAKSNDPQSFADYLTASCASHRYDGMGLGIFNGICAIDLDHCIDSDGNYSQTAAEIIAMMHSYMELSPSGTGVHILFRAEGFRYDTNRHYMHIVYVPVVEKQILWSKRCKDPALRGTVKETIMQVSRSKKWSSQPSVDANGQPLLSKNGKPILRPSYSVLQDRFYDHMCAAGYDDIERGQRGSTEEHLTVTQFKVQQEQQRLAKIQDAQVTVSTELAQLDADKAQAEKDVRKAEAKLERLAPQVEKLEELVRRYPDDPDKVLPEAGAFESARSYREKKAMPLVKKLLKWMHSLFRQNNALSDKCDMLERSKAHEVGIWKRRFERAEEILQQLRPKAEQYDHISRVLDQEQLTQLLSQHPPTHEPTTHQHKGAVR